MKRLLFYILSIFILFPLNGLAQKQGSRQEGKRFEVLRDSGSFNFTVNELIKDEVIRKKYFVKSVSYIKRVDKNTLLITQNNSMKPSLRICVDQGELSPYQGYSTEGLQIISTNFLYTNPIKINSFKVEGVEKGQRSVKVTIYDNISNTCLSEKTFTLSPVIVHKYTSEIQYTDVDGNNQVYTNESACWIPASTSSPAYFIVRDEYGKRVMGNITYSIYCSDSMGDLPIRYTTDTIPSQVLALFNQPSRNPSKCLPKWYVISSYGEKRVKFLEIRK
ncbi:MAG: hypothetical protein IJJ77_06700 [Paludibacteraceae bacterium]|nr:hypothetical protein [Paludibacteraceae bacterium]